MEPRTGDDKLHLAREAFARHEWGDAYEAFTESSRSAALGAEDLVRLAESAWWTGRVDECLEAYERAYRAATDAGDRRLAAHAALWRGFAAPDKSSPVVMGWFANARRLLESIPECEEHGIFSNALTQFTMSQADVEGAYEHANRTFEIGERIGSKDLMALGLFDQGNLLVAMGRVDEGFALLDEAMVAAVSGELQPRITGTIYCAMITTCNSVADYKRAAEWTDAAERWCGRQSIAGFPGLCRVYRAGIMKLRGAWEKAESEMRMAQGEVGQYAIGYLAAGFYEIGEIRLRVGDLEAAEQAFREAHQLGRDPAPGLALLRLQQGDISAAAALINRSVSGQSWDKLARARLRPAQVEIAIAAGDRELALSAAADLRELAETFSSTALKAAAAYADGLVALAEGDAETAVQSLRAGLRHWQEVDAPYEAACVRLALAEAYLALDDTATAGLELDAAASASEKLGARPLLLRARQLAESVRAGPAAGSRGEQTFMLPSLPSSTARTGMTAILFADIADSTALTERLGDDAFRSKARDLDAALRTIIRENGGTPIDGKLLGDGVLAVFTSARQAIEAALASGRAGDEGGLPLHLGLHAGDVIGEEGNVYGGAVNIAARVSALSAPGEVLVSQTVRDLARTSAGVTFEERGRRRLKGVGEPVRVWAVRR